MSFDNSSTLKKTTSEISTTTPGDKGLGVQLGRGFRDKSINEGYGDPCYDIYTTSGYVMLTNRCTYQTGPLRDRLYPYFLLFTPNNLICVTGIESDAKPTELNPALANHAFQDMANQTQPQSYDLDQKFTVFFNEIAEKAEKLSDSNETTSVEIELDGTTRQVQLTYLRTSEDRTIELLKAVREECKRTAPDNIDLNVLDQI